MSDAMTNVEMEDVLASIRRLVSEESAKPAAQVPVANDRFILTPALRVAPADVDAGSGGDAAVADGGSGPSTVTPDAPPAPPAELTQVLTAAAEAGRISDAAASADPAPQSPEFEAMEKAWKAELARVAAARQDVSSDSATSPADAPEPASLEHQIAELEAAVGQTAEDWEPDGSEPEAKQPPRRHIFEIVSNTPNDKRADAAPETSENVPVFSHAAVPRPKPYLLSETVMSVADNDVRKPVGTTEIEDAVPEPADIVEDDDVFLDVEALRNMITEVMRKELHGKLGETITRNVRRMIKQEITTAISGQRLDEDF